MAGEYFMVKAGTIKIDIIHPEVQNAGASITMAILVKTVHIRTRSTRNFVTLVVWENTP